MAIICGLGLLVVCRANWRQAYVYYAGFFAVEMFTVIMLLEILTNTKGLICAALQTRLIVWAGSISYGLYLWHYPIFRRVRDVSALLVVLGHTDIGPEISGDRYLPQLIPAAASLAGKFSSKSNVNVVLSRLPAILPDSAPPGLTSPVIFSTLKSLGASTTR